MSGLWKTNLTMLTLAALLSSSHPIFADDFKNDKPVFTYDQATLIKALKGGHEGKLSQRLVIPGWFNDNKQSTSLKDLGFYLDDSNKQNAVVRYHKGSVANPAIDPEVTKLHFYAGGNFGITGNANDFQAKIPVNTISLGTSTTVGPAVSQNGYMSDADIRAMLVAAGVKDSEALDELVALFHDYIRNPTDQGLSRINAILAMQHVNIPDSNKLILTIRNNGRDSGRKYHLQTYSKTWKRRCDWSHFAGASKTCSYFAARCLG